MTNKMPFPQLREQAIALRRAGKSVREIKQVLGVGSNVTISNALRGEPPPKWTRRPRAKDGLREQARELRARGYTYAEIIAELGVSKSSVSLWVRDMPQVGRPTYQERATSAENARQHHATETLRRQARLRAITAGAAAEIGELSEREMLIAGAVAYWCEGTKNKAHRADNRVEFINSDPGLIVFFLRFLAAAGIPAERVACRLHIHETADVPASQQFWRDITGLPAAQFRSPVLKRHSPKTVRKNTGDTYHGCLAIRVLGASDLYRQIEGWAAAAMAA